eukprot:m51a1_g13028 hypothetical protein (131) ;mRNA; r:2523-2915
MVAADGIVLATPVHFGDMNTEMKALVDRCGAIALRNGHSLDRKVGAAMCVNARAGALCALDAMGRFFGINGLVVPGSSHWALALGGAPGDVEGDAVGKKAIETLGHNVAWLLKCIYPLKFAPDAASAKSN